MKTTYFLTILLLFIQALISFQSDFDPKKHQNWYLLDNQNCGISSTNRIIGGKDASLGQFPWIVRILVGNRSNDLIFTCGGAIINKYYILTAAHCVPPHITGFTIDLVQVGEYDTETNPDCDYDICAPRVQDIKVAEVIQHELYNYPQRFKNDICLLRLETPIEFSEFVSPICMVEGELMHYDHSGQIMDVAGWGVTDIVTNLGSTVLQTLKVPVLSDEACRNEFAGLTVIEEDQLCAGGIIGKDSCGGDSGGPLMKVFDNDGQPRYFIIGVVSFGLAECATTTIPGVYTRVSHFLKWILDNIKP